MRVLARLTHAKLTKLACARNVARNFGVHTWDSKHTRHTKDACHEFALGLLHYTCVKATFPGYHSQAISRYRPRAI